MSADITNDEILEKDIFEILGMSDLPEEDRRKYLNQILETIRNRVMDRMIPLIPKDDLRTWEEKLESDDEKEISDFLKARNIDMQDMMLEETAKYKIEVAAIVDYMKQSGKALADTQDVIDEIGEKAKKEATKQ